jgi:hypothetical protein
MIHNGTYTIQNTTTGEHKTFSIKTQKDDASFAPGKRVAALLIGANNETDYKGFAFVNDDSVVVWASKRGQSAPSSYDWFADMLNVKLLDKASRFGKEYCDYSCSVEKRCLRCNRKLTNPRSLESGYGPECEGK